MSVIYTYNPATQNEWLESLDKSEHVIDGCSMCVKCGAFFIGIEPPGFTCPVQSVVLHHTAISLLHKPTEEDYEDLGILRV